MKKLLVLAMVLVIAGFASAALTITSDAAKVNVDTNIAVIGYDIGLKIVEGDLAFGAVTSNYTWMVPFSTVADPAMTRRYTAANVPMFGGQPQGPGSLFSLAYTGTGKVQLIDFLTNVQGDVIGTFAIPEPMTMALLALGGLFIRRKK